ncbi:hypothetical protein BKA62DRAFT_691378 [Auriculariales sp. MPI-PUGE-AT-0066]|nr:hypothetical protein BKA62DRAFT_691378 [Auriculariales sp. MPI-PUGE-AT-0066]
MSDLFPRSRPSLRRRILGAFEGSKPLASATIPGPERPTSVLRKKRKGTVSPGPPCPPLPRSFAHSISTDAVPVQQPPTSSYHRVSHQKLPSSASTSDDAYGTSASSRSSSEIPTPSSDRRGAWDDEPTSPASGSRRSSCGTNAVSSRATSPTIAAAAAYNPVTFPAMDPGHRQYQYDRPHSSSDYYRLTPEHGQTTGHVRCLSQPTDDPASRRFSLELGLGPSRHHYQPSTLSLRSIDLNRDLPPLPFDKDKPLPGSGRLGIVATSDSDDTPQTTSAGSDDSPEDEPEDYLLAPGTFARIVGLDSDDDEDCEGSDTRHSTEHCQDQCCQTTASRFGTSGSTSRRNSLPASLEGLCVQTRSGPGKLHDVTPCDQTPRPDGFSAVFAHSLRSPGAAPPKRMTHAMREAAGSTGFLARAASLTRATAMNLKGVPPVKLHGRRNLHPAVSPRIEEHEDMLQLAGSDGR